MFESFGSDHPYFGVPVTKEGRAWLLNVVGADAILSPKWPREKWGWKRRLKP